MLRLDIGKFAGIRTRIADAGEIMDSLTVFVTNIELLVIWLVIWPCLHIGAILISRFIFGQTQGSPSVFIAVEVFPAFMLILASLRVPLSFGWFTRLARAIGKARETGTPPPTWTQHPGPLARLLRPSDVDFLLAVVLVVVIEWLTRS